jgi:light-regulated signal transduction histidine kinase (bacteriophytochrome)
MKTNFLEGQWWKFDPVVHTRVREAFARACAGTPVNYDEKLFVFGKVIDINFSLVPVRAAGDRIAYIVAEGRDITPLKLAEAALEGRTKELLAANKELEAFCYSVSHDLRGPLRTIGGFTKVLAEDHAQELDAKAHQYLDRVRRGVERMGGLIDDLLELSSVSRSDLVYTTVDLSALASRVMNELHAAAPDRETTFSVQPGLMAHGDAGLLRVAIENLLGNAWKFSRNKKPSRIEFGASETGGETTFFVRDNGVGFEMKYVNKLFGPFERLHSSSEYEGHGIGLATVQRIIHRHGGKAWAQSAPNQGAIFYFTLADQITTHSA